MSNAVALRMQHRPFTLNKSATAYFAFAPKQSFSALLRMGIDSTIRVDESIRHEGRLHQEIPKHVEIIIHMFRNLSVQLAIMATAFVSAHSYAQITSYIQKGTERWCWNKILNCNVHCNLLLKVHFHTWQSALVHMHFAMANV